MRKGRIDAISPMPTEASNICTISVYSTYQKHIDARSLNQTLYLLPRGFTLSLPNRLRPDVKSKTSINFFLFADAKEKGRL